MLTNTERQQIVEEVNAGTYGIDEALDDIAAAQKGEEVRKALYAEALVLNREGHAGSTDMIARQQIANLQTTVNGQISTLRTEVGEDIDDLEGRIAAQNATIANVVANYNVEYGSTELWASTGETGALAAGTTVTLSEDVSHFDYIDIYSFCGNSNVLDTVPVDAKLQSSQGYALRWVNLSDPGSGTYEAYVRIVETKIKIIGTTLTIVHQVTYRNGSAVSVSGAEITQSNRSTYVGELGIMKIVGRKITANTEIEDVRIGADGTEYASAGQAVRAQVTALESAIPAVDSTLSTQGAAADAKVVGDDVSQLKADLGDIRTASGINLFNPDALIPNTFLDSTTGDATADDFYWATDFIPVDGTYTVRAFEYSGSARTRVYMYNSAKVYDHRAVQAPESFPNGYTFTWTGYLRINIDNGNNGPYENPKKYMLVKGSSSNGVADTFIPYYTAYDRTARADLTSALLTVNVNKTSNYTFTDLNDINDNSIYYVSPSRVTSNYPPNLGAAYIKTTKLNTTNKIQIAYSAYGTRGYIRACVNSTWGDWTEITLGINASDVVTKSEHYEVSSIALFPSVGCCGDSFTAGYLYNKSDSQWYDPSYVPNGEYPAIGYPAVMGRLYGIDVTAYAKGGLTSTAYRTDAKGLPALLTDDPKYLYIIALGLNDKTQNVPLGVEADIDTEPSTPTYLGNMGYIIRQIKAHAPYARIILCKSLWMNNDYYNYISSGVELLSSHLGIPYIETKGDTYFESDYYKNGLKGLHPTAPLYAGIGKRIGELVGKCVIDNPEYFYNFYVPN